MKTTQNISKAKLALITSFVFIALILPSPVQAASVTNTVTFNSTSDLTNNFNPDASPGFTNDPTGGISDTGVVNVPLQMNDIWTTKQGYSVSGVGDTYTFSAFFKIQANAGYGGLGFSNVDTNNPDSFGSPVKGVGMMFHGGGGAFVNNRVNTNVSWIIEKGDLVIGNWYKTVFEVTPKGSNTYDLKFQIWNSDANGVLGTLFTEQTLAGIVNSDLGGSSIIYGYFSAAGWRMEKIDNYLINLEGGVSLFTPTSTSTNSSSNTSTSNPSTPTCNDTKPSNAPDLFQIDLNDSQATLYYAPVSNNISGYYISYSEKQGEFMYGVETHQGQSSGVLSFTINMLNPNKTYYFKLRGQNGCMPGDWSNEMKAETRPKGTTNLLSYYR